MTPESRNWQVKRRNQTCRPGSWRSQAGTCRFADQTSIAFHQVAQPEHLSLSLLVEVVTVEVWVEFLTRDPHIGDLVLTVVVYMLGWGSI